MSRKVLCCFTLVAASVFLPAAFAQDQGRTFHWTGKLADDQVIHIENISGEINAQPATGDEVEVTAEKSGPRADEIRVVEEQTSDGVIVCALYPGMGDSCRSQRSRNSNFHDDRTHVDFTVHVPLQVRFDADNVNGDVNAERLSKPVKASSVNGSVRVSTDGWAEVSSVNGSIDCTMGASDWNGTLKIETVNGSIRLQVPSNLNAQVKFSSVNGRLDSDFPLTVSGRLSGHDMTGTIGSGGRTLRLETVNGNVELRRGSGV